MATPPLTDAPWIAPVWRRLCERHREGRLGHGLLLGGSGPLGQSELATALAGLILCEAPTAEGACGACRACTWLASATHPDLLRVGLAEREDGRLRSEILVEQVRAVTHDLGLTTHQGGAMVVCIEPADALNPAAANALLKTLEEPAAGRYLLLVTARPDALPATVRSRCQKWMLRPPARAEALAWLRAQGIAAAAASEALDWASGQPLQALELARSDGLALCREVATQLDELASGRLGPTAVAAVWAGDRPDARLRAAVAAVARRGWAPSGLTAAVDFTKLAAWSRQADRARALLDVPLRHELLLAELLQSWCGLHRSRAAARRG
ncbi:MAG: DNA polymerase III subunit delta' [Lysobacteraceae bacterium]|nr:MAG: DNA polymerase III subunit delta' [Xanthomonadaceae bacterium]